jgi:hypothetical protein
MKYLYLPDKISLNMSQSKISYYVRYTNHSYKEHPRTPEEIYKFIKSLGIDPDKMASECRNYRKPVPIFENLAGSKMFVTGGVSLYDRYTNEVLKEFTSSGEASISPYQTHLEDAYNARDKAITNNSFSDMGIMAFHGIAAIEGYFTMVADRWNYNHPSERLLDTKEAKVTLIEKFQKWIPIINPQANFKKDDRCWNDFRLLLRIRDNVTHPKATTVGSTIIELAKAINSYKSGIARTLIRLHINFNYYFPAILINSYFFPNVTINENNSVP